jgi:hypothetical protein
MYLHIFHLFFSCVVYIENKNMWIELHFYHVRETNLSLHVASKLMCHIIRFISMQTCQDVFLNINWIFHDFK